MSSQFRETDAQLLLQVVELANQRFLRQSRVHQKSSFNILRMLSAYKEISEGFPSRKQQIYNWIIYITKNYNPQTMKQWQNAIKDLSQGCRKSMSHGQTRSNLHNNGVNVNMNKTTNQFYNQIDQENALINQYDFHNRSEYLPQKISRELKSIKYAEYFSRDNSQTNIMPPISSKIQHYISFEPEQNKQNINSANTNSQHLKSEQLRFDNHPTRTPGERSFIHNLPMSYGSPFVMSKITNNTKDVTQIQQQDQLTPLQANMKTRADLFHDINLKFKAFSALLASFQALQIFQLIIKKTKQFQKSMYLFRFIESARQFKKTKKKRQEYYRTAYQFYELSLTKKSFKILNVLSKLKIQNKDKKKIQLKQFNRVNIQFLTSLIFNPLSEEKQFGQYTDTLKSIRQKSKYFQSIEDCQKMQMISQFFSNNLRMNKEQIKNLFEILHRIRKQQTFNILKSNVRKFTNENFSVALLRKRLALKDFINVTSKIFCSTARVKLMKINSDRKLQYKSFRAFVQFSLSKKIYYKREEFLRQKHKQKVIKQIMEKWKSRSQEKRIRKLGFEACVQQGLTLIVSTLLTKYFATIKKIALQIKQRELKQQRQENKQICKDVFSFLKKRVGEKNVYLKIRERMNRNSKNKIVKAWAKLMKACLLVKQIKKIFTKYALDHIKKEYQQNYKSDLLSDHLKKMDYYRGLKQFRISYNLDKQQCETNIKKIERGIRKNFFLTFNLNCRLQLKLKKLQSQKYEREKKVSNLKQVLVRNTKKIFLNKFVLKSKDFLSFGKKNVIISSVMGNRVISQLGPQSLRKTYTRCFQNLKGEAINELKQNLDMKKKSMKLSNQLKKISKRFILQRISKWRDYWKIKNKLQFFREKQNSKLKRSVWGQFKKQHEDHKTKIEKVDRKYNKYLKFTTLLSFAKELIDIQSKVKQISKIISVNKKLSMTRRFLLLLKQDVQFKKKEKKSCKLTSMKYLSSSLVRAIQLKEKREAFNELRKQKYLKKLINFKKQMKNKRIVEALEDQKYKRFAVMKINKAVFRHILRKKELCMAIKFKAIQLCKISFKALLGNRNIGMISTLGHSKKFRLHEHISTSYTSL